MPPDPTPTLYRLVVLVLFRYNLADFRGDRNAGHRFHSADIERMRRQVQRRRTEIRQLQHSGISSASAETLLDRMLTKIDDLCTERDKLKREQPSHDKGKVLGGRRW